MHVPSKEIPSPFCQPAQGTAGQTALHPETEPTER